jgi:Mg2+-importing ATPase
MDVLCTDKTGTLTEGKISLHALRSLGEKEDDRVLPYALLCNSAAVGETVVGNPMDRAIWEYAKKNAKEQSVASFTKIDEIPFDYQRRIMSVAVRNNSKTILISKGAPESIFARCTHADLSGRIEPLEEVQEAINDKFFHLSQLGYRLLAIGSRVIEDKKSYTIEDEKNLTLIGLLIFTDPAKKDAHEAIDRLKEMGVDVKILTGDNELVAKTICDELEIPVEKIIVGADLVQMSARV